MKKGTPARTPYRLSQRAVDVHAALVKGHATLPAEISCHGKVLDAAFGKGCWNSALKELTEIGIVEKVSLRVLRVHALAATDVEILPARRRAGTPAPTPVAAVPTSDRDANAALVALAGNGNGGIPPLTQLGHFAEQMLHLKAFLASGGDVERRPDGRLNIVVPAPAETT